MIINAKINLAEAISMMSKRELADLTVLIEMRKADIEGKSAELTVHEMGMISKGLKINAMKAHRNRTGCLLKDSKAVVENFLKKA